MTFGSHPEWESLAADPDPVVDLGYVGAEWDVIRTERKNTCHLLFLPKDDEFLKQEAFIVAKESAVVEVDDHR